jgi:hypothetical protein
MEVNEGQRTTALQVGQNGCPESESNERENGTKDRCTVRVEIKQGASCRNRWTTRGVDANKSLLSVYSATSSGLDASSHVREDAPCHAPSDPSTCCMSRIRSVWIPVSHHAVIVRLTSVVNVDHSGSDRGRYIGKRVVRLRQTTRVYAYSHSRTRIVVLV